MIMAVADKTMNLVVEDFTGQMRYKAPRIPRGATVGELISNLASRLRLPLNDSQGRPVTYAARAKGASLNEADLLGDVLQENEVVTLTQNVTAG
jgi:hypothetical protein